MNKETMTIRKALTQKKVLDKQIAELSSTKFVAIATSNRTVIDGMKQKDWVVDAQARFQSLNDKLKRREAITNAIMSANANHTITVKKFIGIDKQSDEYESISFASAIARKKYLSDLLVSIVKRMQKAILDNSNAYQATERQMDEKITERLYQEFSAVTQASGKARQEREAELREQYSVELLDPNKLAENLMSFKEYIENYLAEIDSILGHATEVTEITVEY
jgi:hypothetical protein|nr:MAG TPA: septicolysin [Caudoviricetes sp.]